MTSFTGYYSKFDGPTASGLNDAVPYSPPQPRPALVTVLRDEGQTLAGSTTSHQPLALHSRNINPGYFLREYVDDLYNRILIIPTRVNFGSVGSSVIKTFAIWNAYFVSRTLSSDVLPALNQAITLSGPVPTDVLKSLQVITYTATAKPAGDKTISSTATFTFDVGEPLNLTFSGVRAALFTLRPNWQTSYKVTREYRTTIQKSRSGKEQRRAMRNTPRKTVEYDFTVYGDQLTTFNRTLTKSIGFAAIITDESRSVATTALASAGSSTMVVSSVSGWIAVGVSLTVRSGTVIEDRQVTGISGSTLTFAAATGNDWPSGTSLLPKLAGRFKVDGVAMDTHTDSTASGTLTFEVTPGSEIWIDPPAASVTFNGREVFLTKPNWAQTPNVAFTRPYGIVDYSQGDIAYFNHVAFFSRTEQTSYLGLSAAKTVELENLFDRMKGQRGEFYKPTWQNDMTLAAVSHVGANSIAIPGSDFAATYADDTVYRAICVAFNDGTFDFYQVHRIYVDDVTGNSVIEFPTLVLHDLDPALIQMICWMPVHRFASDTMTTEWITDSVAQIQWTMLTLEDLTPET